MGKQEAKSAYKHFVPPARKVENWHKNFNFVLVESMDDLRGVFKDCVPGKYFMSFDTETTGLDAEELELVGYSFCIDGKTSYYVPVYHFEYSGNLGEESVEFIYNRMVEAKKVFMYNMKFDARVLEYRGYKEHKEDLDKQRWLFVKYDMSKVPYFDVSIPVWLGDTNIKLPSLKWAATHYLGFDMMHFDEVTESTGNFFYLNPSENPDTVFYAASDALCTYLLVPATMKYFSESGFAGKIDNKVLYPLMHYEHEKLWLDTELVNRLMVEITEEVDKCERGVYDALGYQINLNSPAQVSQAFERLGIDTGQRTASGFMKTGMNDLEALPDHIKKQYPALDMFVEYKTLFKLKSSYVSVLQKEADRNGFLRGAYKTQQVPTGRLAAGKDAKNTYFSPINLQALPKPHVSMYDVFDLGDRSLFDKKENIIMGYKFVLSKYEKDENGNKVHVVPDDPSYLGWAEGMNPKNNIRACITPKLYEDSKDGEFIYCAIDYAAQELRIPANLSREPVWVNAFVSGGDVHKSTAISIWGEEKYNKDYRKMAKAANFSILYGAAAQSFADNPMFNMNLTEAEEFYNTYKKALPTLFLWEERLQRRGRREGYVSTYFGRPRRVKGYFDNRNFAFANRTIVNTTVQGTASDLLKYVLCRLWGSVLNNPKYKDDCAWRCTIHDEIQYTIRSSRANEIASVLEDVMRVKLPEWPVVIDIEVSFGHSAGGLFAFFKVVHEDGTWHYEPKLD